LTDPNKDWLKRWFVVVNKNAGNRKAGKDWTAIKELLTNNGFDFHAFFTNDRGDAVQIVRDQLEKGLRKMIVVGGDGTVNEAVNGIFGQGNLSATDVILGLVPVGTGNDWGRMYGTPKNYEEAVMLIKYGKVFHQDIGFVNFELDGHEFTQYFANNSGIGYDARVAKETNKLKEKGRAGTLAYLSVLVSGLFKYRYQKIRMEIDGKTVFEGPYFTLTLGICSYNGGGMKQLPHAVPDDGQLEVTVIRAVRKDIIIRNLYKVYSGSHVKLPIVDTYRGSEVKIYGIDVEIPELETDGESYGEGPFSFGVLPKALGIIVRNDWQLDL
jgi:YegS/Rv2252/BmrU family lipid kinase